MKDVQVRAGRRLRTHVPRIEDPAPDTPFATDALKTRQSFAEQLTQDVEEFAKDGGTLVLNGAWGSGKTWFAKNWEKHLSDSRQGFTVHYVNCFTMDYLEDAFLLLASELYSIKGLKPSTDFKSAALKVTKTLAPAVLRTSSAVVNLIMPGAGIALNPEVIKSLGDALESASEKSLDKYFQEKIKKADESHKTVEHFRKILTEFAALSEKPVVLIIDELDRCRPPFAIQLIERIKHFFEVPNLVVVLVTSLPQLEAYVRGVYGAEVDAPRYLQKFYKRAYTLPNLRGAQGFLASSQYAVEYLSKSGITQSPSDIAETWDFLQRCGGEMTLRDVHTATTLLSSIGFDDWESIPAPMLIYLKLVQPEIYSIIANGASGEVELTDFRLRFGPILTSAPKDQRLIPNLQIPYYSLQIAALQWRSPSASSSLVDSLVTAIKQVPIYATGGTGPILKAVRSAIDLIEGSRFVS